MTVSTLPYYRWANRTDWASATYERCSPALDQLRAYVTRWGGASLGCHNNRPIRGGSTTMSTHAWGAAEDTRFPNRTTTLVVMQWLIDHSQELGVNAIHDYEGQRIWYVPTGWHPADIQEGDWIHTEIRPEAWGDGRTVDAKLATAPPLRPAGKMGDMGQIVKTTSGKFFYTTGTLYTACTPGRDLDLKRLMIGLQGGNSSDLGGISDAEVAAGFIGMDVDTIATRLRNTEAAIAAAAAQATAVLAAANAAKVAAQGALDAGAKVLASVNDDDEALAALRVVVEETQAAANAAEAAALEAKRAAEEVEQGQDITGLKLVLEAEGRFEPLTVLPPSP